MNTQFVHDADGKKHRRIEVTEFERWKKRRGNSYECKLPKCNFPLLPSELNDSINRFAEKLIETQPYLARRKFFKDVTEAQWLGIKDYVCWSAGWICEYCQGIAHTADHIIPFVDLGSSHPNNLVAVCKKCNSSKGATPVDVWKKRRGLS